ncbi:MAG: class I SAM-dependent methyltransferase [Candidatus Sungbacteria bacterium]|nr:class I SAM-dependent methyltransferase [Candidatus Sungbacteria bacterium]
MGVDSKPWAWNKTDYNYDCWETPDDEFLSVFLRWKNKGYSRALDLGCGTGRHSIFLAQNGFTVDAFDLSLDGLQSFEEKIQDKNFNITIKAGDMLDLPYGRDAFDCVLAFHAIHHTDMVGLKKTIKNIYDVLKPEGEVFLTLTSKEGDSWKKHANNRIDNNTLIKTEGPEVDVPHTYLSYEEARELLTDFQLIKIQQIIRYFPNQNKKHSHFFVLLRK